MARDLGDVLHYFIDGTEGPETEPPGVLAVAVGERDVVRAAFVWNLAVELARETGVATAVAPVDREAGLLWPEPGRGPCGAEFVPSFAEDLASWSETVGRVVHDLPPRRMTAPLLAQVPAEWLEKADEGHPLLARSLLFVTPDRRELERARALARRLLGVAPDARVGVTVHGVTSVEEARESFLRLAAAVEADTDRPLHSYGLLLDDLDVWRAIVERRAIGVVRPQSRAARALRDVARLLREDARPDA